MLTVKLNDGTILKFDDYEDERLLSEDYDTFFVGMCSACLEKYRDSLKASGCTIDNFGSGCCSVYGCNHTDHGELDDAEDDTEYDIFYIYIPANLCTVKEKFYGIDDARREVIELFKEDYGYNAIRIFLNDLRRSNDITWDDVDVIMGEIFDGVYDKYAKGEN